MTLIPPELFGVPMIPFGLLSAFVNKKEIRITEFSETGFRFRTALLSGRWSFLPIKKYPFLSPPFPSSSDMIIFMNILYSQKIPSIALL